MKLYHLKVYIDDGLSRRRQEEWTLAESATKAEQKIKAFYNNEYDTTVRIESIEQEADENIIFACKLKSTTIYSKQKEE